MIQDNWTDGSVYGVTFIAKNTGKQFYRQIVYPYSDLETVKQIVQDRLTDVVITSIDFLSEVWIPK